ncbi:hypothetical protein GCM10020000_87150 [Streptomyces olivoverticillatus]
MPASAARSAPSVEYTSQPELQDLTSREWTCPEHSDVLSPETPSRTAVFTVAERFTTRRLARGRAPRSLGLFFTRDDRTTAQATFESGVRAYAHDFPPGTRLIVTAHIELPTAQEGPRT